MATVSVLIPAFNEEQTILEVLERVRSAPTGDLRRQVIVVDDGSSDRTWQLAHSLDWPELVLVRHETNRGKGWAIRTALAHATGDYAIVQDADLEYSPSDYPALLSPLLSGRSQVVYGSRFAASGGTAPGYPAIHRLGVRLLNLAVRVLYGGRTTDEATCYKAFRLDVLREIPLDCERFEFCPEITAKTLRKGLKIHEVPITFFPRTRHEGKKIRWLDGWVALKTLWRYRNWDPGPAPPMPTTPTLTSQGVQANPAGTLSHGGHAPNRQP